MRRTVLFRCDGSGRLALSAPTLASDELDVVAETAGGPSFPAWCCFEGPVPPTVPIVSFGVEGPDVATLTSEVRVYGAMPRVAAIALDVPNVTGTVWLLLLFFPVLIDLSCWLCICWTGTGLIFPVSAGIWPAWVSVTVSVSDISVGGLATLLPFALVFERVSMLND